jgi:hypothetical protein
MLQGGDFVNKYQLTRAELESVFRSSAADKEWDVVTTDPRMIRYLKRQGYDPKTDHQLSDYVSCKVPFRKVRIRKLGITLSAEQRSKLASRFKTGPKKQAVADIKI